MAHAAKYTKAAIGHMFDHYGRSDHMEKSGYVIRGNDCIDPERTHLNYNLAEHQKMSQLDFIHQRLSEIKVQNRKDVNVMCDWIVTVPKDLPADEHRQFFKETYNFLENRYGKENVISAYVHNDETTPHIHFAFVPVVWDQKKDRWKCSAKERVGLKDLNTFHSDLSAHLEGVFGRDVGILNGATKEGNKTVRQLKRETAEQEVERIKEQTAQLQQELNVLQITKKAAEQAAEVPTKKTLTGKEYVPVDPEEYKKLCAAAAKSETLEKEVVKARKINKNADKIIGAATDQAATILSDAKTQARQISFKSIQDQSEVQKNKDLIEFAKMIINKIPKISEMWERFKAEKSASRESDRSHRGEER